MKLQKIMISIATFIIISLLGVNAYFAKNMVRELKEDDKILGIEIEKVDTKYSDKFILLTKSVSDNESQIKLSNKDTEYIIKSLNEIKADIREIKEK